MNEGFVWRALQEAKEIAESLPQNIRLAVLRSGTAYNIKQKHHATTEGMT